MPPLQKSPSPRVSQQSSTQAGKSSTSKTTPKGRAQPGRILEWRYDTPLRLQIVLGGLQNLVQISTLAEVIKEVEDELLHCEKQMADHPALEQGLIASSAGDTYSDNSITPSESASVKARKRREAEKAAAEVCNP